MLRLRPTQVLARCEPEGEAVLQIHFEGYLAANSSGVRAGSFLDQSVRVGAAQPIRGPHEGTKLPQSAKAAPVP